MPRIAGEPLLGNRTGASCQTASAAGHARKPAFTFCGEPQASAEVLARKLREIGENLILTHPASEIGQNVPDRDPRTADDRLPESNFGIDDDALSVVHTWTLCHPSVPRTFVATIQRSA